jgi:hypothetical protein
MMSLTVGRLPESLAYVDFILAGDTDVLPGDGGGAEFHLAGGG